VSWDEERRTRTLGLLVYEGGQFLMPLGDHEIDLGKTGVIQLRATGSSRDLQFAWSGVDGAWKDFGPAIDLAKFSDEHPWPMAFTGLFVGIAAHDLTGNGRAADFDRFSYVEGEGSQ
jgi:xylan 1,4-beta-xylosidase